MKETKGAGGISPVRTRTSLDARTHGNKTLPARNEGTTFSFTLASRKNTHETVENIITTFYFLIMLLFSR